MSEEQVCSPVFSQNWWLNAVAGKNNWNECRVEKDGKLVASLPYVVTNRMGFKYITQPKLTQTLGPWFSKPNPGTKYAQILAREKDLTEELIEQLPPFDLFHQNFTPEITNWLPWYWNGFKQTTRYTYRLNDLSDIDKLYNNLQRNIRGHIRKSIREGFEVYSTDSIEKFIQLNEKTFKNQGIKRPYSKELILRLNSACVNQNARKIFMVRDSEGRIHAGIYIVFNKYAAYNLMIGSDPELRSSGAISLCMWEAIKFASTVTDKFDFEGSMIETIERFFRGFGAIQTPYYSVSKISSPLLRFRRSMKELFYG